MDRFLGDRRAVLLKVIVMLILVQNWREWLQLMPWLWLLLLCWCRVFILMLMLKTMMMLLHDDDAECPRNVYQRILRKLPRDARMPLE